ncbi:MAG: hypothetical protein SF097_09090 [Acidobacteriota bacterium]|nr:hypothetical protein [Acidobacteriota bacterium]
MNLKQFIVRRVFAWCLGLFLFTTLLIWPVQSQEQEKDAAPRKAADPLAKLRDFNQTEAFEKFDDPVQAAEYFRAKRLPPSENEIPVERYLKAQERMQQMAQFSTAENRGALSRAQLRKAGLDQQLGEWTSLGPGNIGGRTRAILIHPQTPNVMYAAGVSGGVWKTTNAGQSWTQLTDLLPNLIVVSLAFDPQNPEVIYAGTGEFFGSAGGTGGATIRGAGIFKTGDGGVTWTPLSFTANNASFFTVNDLVVSPNDSRRVYAGTGNGVWRSLDGGANWTQVLTQNVFNGCSDLAIRSDRTTDFVFAACGNFQQATVFRNTDAAGSGGWNAVLTENNMGRTALAIAPSNQNTIYAVTVALSGTHANGLHAVFRSTDGGASGSWTPQVRNTDPIRLNTAILSRPENATATDCGNALNNIFNNGQGFYDLAIAVDPTDENRVWVGGIELFRSDDGGRNWGLASFAVQGRGRNLRFGDIYADQHTIVFHPNYDGAGNQTMYVGNDGGIYRTENARAFVPGGAQGACNPAALQVKWTALNNGYVVTQFYHGLPYPDGKRYLGGIQDKGSLRGSDAGGINGWRQIANSDGGHNAIDPNDPNTIYIYLLNPNVITFLKSTDDGVTFSRANFGINEAGLFVAPMQMDPSDSQRLYTGALSLFRTTNGAANWSNIGTLGSGTTRISALDVAPTDANRLLAGLNNGTIFRTNRALALDGRTAFAAPNEITAAPRQGFVSRVMHDPTNPDIAYATYATFGGTHVWRTMDGGLTWRALDGSGAGALPDVPVHCIVIDPTNTARLYIGSDLGVFVSNDGGANWAIENTGFANVITESLSLLTVNGETWLYAFTHGRGAWRVRVNANGCNYKLGTPGQTLGSAGGAATVNVTSAPSSCGWKAESNVPWIGVTSGATGSGNGAVGLRIEENKAFVRRFGTVAIAGRSFAVTQEGELDASAPTVTITAPGATTTANALTLLGTAADNARVAAVTWRNSRGQSGAASGTTEWRLANLPLQPGLNVITVIATDDAGNAGSSTVTITARADNGDQSAPTVQINAPTSAATFTATNTPLMLGGTAADNTGVATVQWSNDRGGSGTASLTTTGTTAWTIPQIALQPGVNNLTVTAWDANGNSSSANLAVTFNPSQVLVTIAGTGVGGGKGDNGPAVAAETWIPSGVAVDVAGNVFVADTQNHRIRKIAPNGVITTVAGSGAVGFAGDGGPATTAALNEPNDVVVDAVGNLYFSDTLNNRVRRVNSAGVITTVAGSGLNPFTNELPPMDGDGGPATAARLNQPFGLALDAAGNLFIADAAAARIRRVAANSGIITTVAGNGLVGSAGNGGPAIEARLLFPTGVAVDRTGNIYIADINAHQVRRVAADTGIITTIAGTGAAGFNGDNIPANTAQLRQPAQLALDAAGDLYIVEFAGQRIRKLTQSTGLITTVAGTGTAGLSGDGSDPTGAQLNLPFDVALDAAGNLFIADANNNRVRRTVASSAVGALAGVSAASFSSTVGLAPEAMVAAFGTNLASATTVAASLPLPIALAGTTVSVRDSLGVERFALLFFVSPTQINYLMPNGTANGPATITISGSGALSTGTVNISNVAPGLFTRTANGLGAPAAVASTDGGLTFPIQLSNADGTPVEIQAGTIVVLFGTALRFHSGVVTASAGGVTSTPLFVGAQGGFAGLDQINWIVPQELAGKGELDLTFTLDGKTTNPVKIKVR